MTITDEKLREAVSRLKLATSKDHWVAIDTIEAALTELMELRAANTWQPIETAPMDGTPVLVFGGIAYWRADAHAWYTITGSAYPGRVIEWPVTHWMPLPTPPKEVLDERR